MNKKISYYIEDNSLFTIDDQTGILSSVTSLDREERAMYNFTVTATDHGTPQRSARTSVLILVSGIFNNFYVFVKL